MFQTICMGGCLYFIGGVPCTIKLAKQSDVSKILQILSHLSLSPQQVHKPPSPHTKQSFNNNPSLCAGVVHCKHSAINKKAQNTTRINTKSQYKICAQLSTTAVHHTTNSQPLRKPSPPPFPRVLFIVIHTATDAMCCDVVNCRCYLFCFVSLWAQILLLQRIALSFRSTVVHTSYQNFAFTLCPVLIFYNTRLIKKSKKVEHITILMIMMIKHAPSCRTQHIPSLHVFIALQHRAMIPMRWDNKVVCVFHKKIIAPLFVSPCSFPPLHSWCKWRWNSALCWIVGYAHHCMPCVICACSFWNKRRNKIIIIRITIIIIIHTAYCCVIGFAYRLQFSTLYTLYWHSHCCVLLCGTDYYKWRMSNVIYFAKNHHAF